MARERKHTGMRVLLRTNIVQLDDIAALTAAFKGTVTRNLYNKTDQYICLNICNA